MRGAARIARSRIAILSILMRVRMVIFKAIGAICGVPDS